MTAQRFLRLKILCLLSAFCNCLGYSFSLLVKELKVCTASVHSTAALTFSHSSDDELVHKISCLMTDPAPAKSVCNIREWVWLLCQSWVRCLFLFLVVGCRVTFFSGPEDSNAALSAFHASFEASVFFTYFSWLVQMLSWLTADAFLTVFFRPFYHTSF